VIPEPQRTYVLELLKALGPTAEDFVIAGAQAIKFMLKEARGTKDVDFVLDVARLREKEPSVRNVLRQLGYRVVEGSNNFQFEKPIPNSKEVMRVEFMAPEEFKRDKDFRVDVEEGIHARFCTGGSIAIAESSVHPLSGKLPDGADFAANVRVTKPHALVMLKLLALDDRYRNIRGPEQAKHMKGPHAGFHRAVKVSEQIAKISVAEASILKYIACRRIPCRSPNSCSRNLMPK
jgi:Nucleotidyl transferase AbiEii toxin, Type IV TA system